MDAGSPGSSPGGGARGGGERGSSDRRLDAWVAREEARAARRGSYFGSFNRAARACNDQGPATRRPGGAPGSDRASMSRYGGYVSPAKAREARRRFAEHFHALELSVGHRPVQDPQLLRSDLSSSFPPRELSAPAILRARRPAAPSPRTAARTRARSRRPTRRAARTRSSTRASRRCRSSSTRTAAPARTRGPASRTATRGPRRARVSRPPRARSSRARTGRRAPRGAAATSRRTRTRSPAARRRNSARTRAPARGGNFRSRATWASCAASSSTSATR